MNPCDVCGDRILDYPGVCKPCLADRRALRKRTQATYRANTAAHRGDRYATQPDSTTGQSQHWQTPEEKRRTKRRAG